MNHKLLQSSVGAYWGPYIAAYWNNQQIVAFGTLHVLAQNYLPEPVVLQCWGWNTQAKVVQVLLMIYYPLSDFEVLASLDCPYFDFQRLAHQGSTPQDSGYQKLALQCSSFHSLADENS